MNHRAKLSGAWNISDSGRLGVMPVETKQQCWEHEAGAIEHSRSDERNPLQDFFVAYTALTIRMARVNHQTPAGRSQHSGYHRR